MIRSFRSILSRPETVPPAAAEALPRPEFTTYVVGDLHGRADLLERALDRVDEHVGQTGARNPQVVFVGDYIDHGPDSANVLTRVWELSRELPQNVTCLMGNHERMLLDFLADPATRGPRWLRSGALATLDSFGLHTSQLAPGCAPDLFRQEALALRDHMAPELLDWLEDLPLSWNSGNLWVVHAGADPQHAMSDQSPRVLLWGHPEFDSRPRADGTWVVHGHVPGEGHVLEEGRICVDTGAWQSGLLCTAAIAPSGQIDFLYA
jgi:serine/threonine protein phosphatase 1